MPGIVIFGGTVEGRELTEQLQHTGLQLHICVATEYGASLLPKGENIHIYSGRMNEPEMEHFLLEQKADYCLDATHPYAVEVTQNISAACKNVGIPYIRIVRQTAEPGQNVILKQRTELEQNSSNQKMDIEQDGEPKDSTNVRDRVKIEFVSDIAEAADYLCHTTGNIFITTGSKELEKYTMIPDYRTRCIARVLPTLPVMQKCKELGFEGKNLIGMQGPFSEEMNYCMLKQADAAWLVTKNSGKAGGYEEKCEAALRLGVGILVIGRPAECEENHMELEEAVHFLKEKYARWNEPELQHQYVQWNKPGLQHEYVRQNELKSQRTQNAVTNQCTIYLVAMGPGSGKLLTGEAMEVLEQADVLIGARRVLEICPWYREKPHFISYKKDETVKYLKEHPEYRNVAVCYSGDIGFYSGAKGMQELLEKKNADLSDVEERAGQPEWDIRQVSGISSAAYFLNKISVPWDGVELVSCHGREMDFISLLAEKKKVCALLGGREAVSNLCRQLLDSGMEQVRMTVGECLSYPEERIVTGSPDELLGREFNSLSVILLEYF